MLKHLSTEERRTLANRGALKRKNPGKIRLSVFRSGRHIEVQAIDDVKGHTVCAASSKEKGFAVCIEQAANAVRGNMVEKIKAMIDSTILEQPKTEEAKE